MCTSILRIATATLHTHMSSGPASGLCPSRPLTPPPPGLHHDCNELPSACSSLVWICCSLVISAEGFHLRSPVIKWPQMDALSVRCCGFVRHVPCAINNLGLNLDFYRRPPTCFRDGVAPLAITVATGSRPPLSLSEFLHTRAGF